jgi:hypothetical protein
MTISAIVRVMIMWILYPFQQLLTSVIIWLAPSMFYNDEEKI